MDGDGILDESDSLVLRLLASARLTAWWLNESSKGFTAARAGAAGRRKSRSSHGSCSSLCKCIPSTLTRLHAVCGGFFFGTVCRC